MVRKDPLSELAQAFDDTFRHEAVVKAPAVENLLMVGTGGRTYGLRCSQLQTVLRSRSITKLPGAQPGMLGLVGFRGQLLSVFSLAHGLHRPSDENPTWLALAKTSDKFPVAVAFEVLLRQTPICAGHLVNEFSSPEIEAHWTGEDEAVPVVSLPILIAKFQSDTISTQHG